MGFKVDVVAQEANLRTVTSLGEPKTMWEAFARLSAVPRPSGKEEDIRGFVRSVAEKKKLAFKEDAFGNVLIKVPGKGGPAVLIQGHLDMVTEKNSDVHHDFEEQGIQLAVQDGFLRSAKKTTLGADNGIGVATALALLEEPAFDHPPLELLFTLDEERGLVGARNLDSEGLGITARTLLNLDTEEWASIYCGCSGGGDSVFQYGVEREESSSSSSSLLKYYKVVVKGCTGGHSGVDIHRNRCNAIEALAGVCQVLLGEKGAKLVSLTGGDKRNAIPREAEAVVAVVENGDLGPFVAHYFETAVKPKFADTDPLAAVAVTEVVPNGSGPPPPPLTAECGAKLLGLLAKDITRGVVKFSEAIPGLVETSSNLASIKANDGGYEIVCSTRSSVTSELERVRDDLAAAVQSAGGKVTVRSEPYTGWNPNLHSKVLNLTKQKYASIVGVEPEIKAIHAGLECGLLIAKIAPDLDCVSFGPTIFDAHTPDERLQIDTVKPFFDLVKLVLNDLCD
eukprot:CAMPEP_0118900478 /NCGR_PEP_ID=MMETSP1166-20130328/6573_1 /TAXON_ID=1104430 /ORGANISM="Chrysoreinhardia sp, Strain CCMP3193" /LENGTH=508 /DNA_ID=CAMNT_0006839621 /DNA_START=56 /DNA_END=1582 /DNA_ORIENTATION=-